MTKTKSRKKNSIRNLLFGVLYQVVNLILLFACRTLLIKKLGSDILGINSLYSNILTLFSLAELGISNVMLFKLYKPIANNDEEKISAYLNYYRKIYNVIALIVLIIGLVFIPLLRYIVSNDINISNADLIIYYLIFLFNTVSSYLIVYKQTLINANQQFYILKLFNLALLVVQSTLKITFLLIKPNYKIYLIIDCVSNLANNIILNFYANKKYPMLKNKSAQLSKSEKQDLMSNVKDTFLYKIGSVIINNSDSIIISTVLSTVVVGYLSNYNMIITALNGFVSILTSSLFASIGNLAVENNPEKSKRIYDVVLFIYHIIGAVCGICLFMLFNDFMSMWLQNSEYILDIWIVSALSFNFYFMISITPNYIFRENFGLFKKAKYVLLYASIINIISSIIFAYMWGLVGVILGTILCRLLTSFYMEPIYLYKDVFNMHPKDYFIRQFKMFVVSAISFVICFFVCKLFGVGIWQFVVKGCLCCGITLSLFAVTYCKSPQFIYLKNMALSFLKGNKKGKQQGVTEKES